MKSGFELGPVAAASNVTPKCKKNLKVKLKCSHTCTMLQQCFKSSFADKLLLLLQPFEQVHAVTCRYLQI